MSFATKYRPKKFQDVVGQQSVVHVMKQLATTRRDLRVLLLHAMHGVGKTTLARLYAKLINCEENGGDVCGVCKSCVAMDNQRHPDYVERDMGSYGIVSEVRRLQEETLMKPSWNYRVFVLDEAHGCSREAFNALLKLLEEPPPSACLMLLTTELSQVPYVIVSRSLLLSLMPLEISEMTGRLLEISEKEGGKLTEGAARLIAQASGGSMRDCCMTFERLFVAGKGEVDEKLLEMESWFVGEGHVNRFLVAISKRDYSQYSNLQDELTNRLSYDRLINAALKKLCLVYIKNNKGTDRYIESLWKGVVRMRRGVEPALVYSGIWLDVCKKEEGK